VHQSQMVDGRRLAFHGLFVALPRPFNMSNYFDMFIHAGVILVNFALTLNQILLTLNQIPNEAHHVLAAETVYLPVG